MWWLTLTESSDSDDWVRDWLRPVTEWLSQSVTEWVIDDWWLSDSRTVSEWITELVNDESLRSVNVIVNHSLPNSLIMFSSLPSSSQPWKLISSSNLVGCDLWVWHLTWCRWTIYLLPISISAGPSQNQFRTQIYFPHNVSNNNPSLRFGRDHWYHHHASFYST